MSDHIGAKLLYPSLPPVETLIADTGYDSVEFREGLAARNIKARIPPKRNPKILHGFHKQRYKIRHKIESVFGKLKDWQRISTRYDCCAHASFSAIYMATSVILYLKANVHVTGDRAR